jgi:hypothetical protein
MTQPNTEPVHAYIMVDYEGTIIKKSVTISGYETSAVKVNQALELLTKRIQIMVQSEQGIT